MGLVAHTLSGAFIILLCIYDARCSNGRISYFFREISYIDYRSIIEPWRRRRRLSTVFYTAKTLQPNSDKHNIGVMHIIYAAGRVLCSPRAHSSGPPAVSNTINNNL